MNNKLNIKIEQLKNINNIELNLPIETGLYAITELMEQAKVLS